MKINDLPLPKPQDWAQLLKDAVKSGQGSGHKYVVLQGSQYKLEEQGKIDPQKTYKLSIADIQKISKAQIEAGIQNSSTDQLEQIKSIITYNQDLMRSRRAKREQVLEKHLGFMSKFLPSLIKGIGNWLDWKLEREIGSLTEISKKLDALRQSKKTSSVPPENEQEHAFKILCALFEDLDDREFPALERDNEIVQLTNQLNEFNPENNPNYENIKSQLEARIEAMKNNIK